MNNVGTDNAHPEPALAKYACDLTFNDVDDDAKLQISKMIFDAISISIGAYNEKHASGQINEDFILENNMCESGPSLWTGRGNLPADLAALCNGTWAEILDYQDVIVDPRNNGHLGVTIIPAALAVAEREHCSGAELITAIAAGIEVAIAVLRAVGRKHRSEGRGFRTTSIAGPLGAVVACSKLLKLNDDQILNAMGIAGACSPNGLMPSLSPANGTFGMDKDWVNGLAAQLAVNAADLAKRGMTASDRVVTGDMGILASHSHGDSQVLATPHRATPNIRTISLKKYACCYGVHSAMEASIELCTSHRLSPEKLNKIVVFVKEDSAKTLSTRNITNHMAARFSLPYAVASAIVRKENSSMHDFEEPAIFDSAVLDLLNIIEISPDQELTDFHKQTGGFPARVEIHAGELIVENRVDYPVGSSQRPMSWDDLELKFIELTKGHFSSERQQNIINAGKNIATTQDIVHFTRLL